MHKSSVLKDWAGYEYNKVVLILSVRICQYLVKAVRIMLNKQGTTEYKRELMKNKKFVSVSTCKNTLFIIVCWYMVRVWECVSKLSKQKCWWLPLDWCGNWRTAIDKKMESAVMRLNNIAAVIKDCMRTYNLDYCIIILVFFILNQTYNKPLCIAVDRSSDSNVVKACHIPANIMTVM